MARSGSFKKSSEIIRIVFKSSLMKYEDYESLKHLVYFMQCRHVILWNMLFSNLKPEFLIMRLESYKILILKFPVAFKKEQFLS